MIGKKSKGGGKANGEALLVAGILEAHGYEIRSVKQGGKGGALVVKVFPPILSGARRADFGTGLPD